MIRIGLAGGRGYVGEELLELLSGIPEYQVVYVGSRGAAGKPIAQLYEGLELDLAFQDLSPESINACPADVWIVAQPNGQAADFVDRLENQDAKIVDISSDFRFDETWAYGLPESNQAKIRTASRIANPGCYATATQLALLPMKNQLVGTPVAFGVSGFSGAGRTPSEKNDPGRLKENLLPYSLAGHIHEREISRQLERDVRFMPHVASFFRGISMTVSFRLDRPVSPGQMASIYKQHYTDHPLTEVADGVPEIRDVAGTNRSRVGGFTVDPRDQTAVTVVSVIDNLRKGAASQAIQNVNLMCGFESCHGLL